MSLQQHSGPRPAGRIAVLVYFSPPRAANEVISMISLAVLVHGGMQRRLWAPLANGPVDKRAIAVHTAVITLFSRHISHRCPGTGFGIRRFDAL